MKISLSCECEQTSGLGPTLVRSAGRDGLYFGGNCLGNWHTLGFVARGVVGICFRAYDLYRGSFDRDLVNIIKFVLLYNENQVIKRSKCFCSSMICRGSWIRISPVEDLS